MKTNFQDRSKRLVWLRFGMIAFVLLGVITLLLMTNSALPVEAAAQLTLQPGDQLIVTPDGGCSLKIVMSSKVRVNLGCDAFTPTAAEGSGSLSPAEFQNRAVEFASEVVSAPEAKVWRSIKPGKKLAVLATIDMCNLKVVDETAALIKIKCKPSPTPTPTVTRTRTPSPTPKPGSGPDGRWQGITDQSRPILFFVTNNLGSWHDFFFQVTTPSCYITIQVFGPASIQNKQLSVSGTLSGQYSGSFEYNGTFNSNTYVKGSYSLTNFGHQQCGTVTRNGQWDAHWKSVNVSVPAPDASVVKGEGWQVTFTPR